MKYDKSEVIEASQVAPEVHGRVRELADLELALVGGGCGEVIFG